MFGQVAALDRSVRLSLAYYINFWVFDVQTRRGGAQAFLVSSSPADGVLTVGALAEVTEAIQHAITALPAVRPCQVTPIDAGRRAYGASLPLGLCGVVLRASARGLAAPSIAGCP